MTKSLAIVLLIATLSGWCNGQCITENDTFPMENDSSNFTGISEFGIELFKDLFPYNTSQNFFFSPYSIWSALTLAYFGSAGNTEAQLAKVLHHEDKESAITQWRSIDFMYAMRQEANAKYTLNVANRAYFDNNVELRPCMTEIFKNEIRKTDFLTNASESATEINNWVSNVTKARIPKLVNPGDISGANMALINAAFFKGTWLYQFKSSKTEKQLFYISKDDYTFVEMMNQKGNFRYGVSETLGAHILELPYSGESVSMFILLPPFLTGSEGFDAMVDKLNAQTLEEALYRTWRVQIEVTIPKFKLEQDIGNELITSLKNLGISDVFDSSVANMTSFSPNADLSIGKAIHKSFLEINEEGTEAAASTSFISFRVARPIGPKKFICNHPFMFVIYDNLTKNIIFMGAYKNPRA